MAPKVKVITGAPCSGKSTYVQQNFGSKDIRFDFDRIAAAITDGGSHDLDRDHLMKPILDFRDSLIQNLRAGKYGDVENVWMIVSAPKGKVKDSLDALGAEYIPMETSREECLARLEKDASRKDKDAWEKRINAYFQENGSAVSGNIDSAHSGRKNGGNNMKETKITEQPAEPTTDPAGTGEKGEKLFTQEEVNRIVRDRLAKVKTEPQVPKEPTELEKREAAIAAKENRARCQEYLDTRALPLELLDILDTSKPEEFYQRAEAVRSLLRAAKGPAPLFDPSYAQADSNDNIAAAFAKGRHIPRDPFRPQNN